MEKILIGSRYFFSSYKDFRSHDYDYVAFVDTNDFQQMCRVRSKRECVFIMKRHEDKEAYIDWALQQKAGMVIGKFLVPEVCKEMGFKLTDLLKLESLLDKLDEKHEYERIIYDSYLINGDFVLTDEQRQRAYDSYKESRGGQRVWALRT